MSIITTTDYAISARVDTPYEQVIEQIRAALKEEGFGILTEIDVKQTLKQKIDADWRRYVILGACNPVLAHQSLQEELEIGLLLPCNVIVYEEGDGSVVSIADPVNMMKVVENPDVEPIAQEARIRLQRALESLAG